MSLQSAVKDNTNAFQIKSIEIVQNVPKNKKIFEKVKKKKF